MYVALPVSCRRDFQTKLPSPFVKLHWNIVLAHLFKQLFSSRYVAHACIYVCTAAAHTVAYLTWNRIISKTSFASVHRLIVNFV